MVIKSQNESYLMHAGIKDMRWGVRRWRNYDGSLTEEGKERYNYYDSKGRRGVAKAMEKAYYDRWDNSKGDSPTTKNIKSAQSFVGDTEKGLDKLGVGMRKKDLSMMTNQELRDATERARLEKEYSNYYPTVVKTDTRKKLDRFLAAAGTALALGASASVIYSNIVTAQKNRNEAYDKSEDDAKIGKAVKDFLSDIGSKSAKDITDMDDSVFNSLKDSLKQRAAAWQQVAILQGKGKNN